MTHRLTVEADLSLETNPTKLNLRATVSVNSFRSEGSINMKASMKR